MQTTTTLLLDQNSTSCYVKSAPDRLLSFTVGRNAITEHITNQFAMRLMTPNVTLCEDKKFFISEQMSNSSCDAPTLRRKCTLSRVSKTQRFCDFVCECEHLSCEMFVVLSREIGEHEIHLCEIQVDKYSFLN